MLSFIVIGKDEGWRLEKCLSSIYSFIKEEKIREFEIIYVDSKSKDNSLSIAKQYKVDKIYLITGVCNAAIGRNIGAKESIGDILFFLDGDMELIPGFYKEIVDNKGNLIYPFVSGIVNNIFHDNDWNIIESKESPAYIKNVDQYYIVTGGLFIVKRDLWFGIGGMDNCQKKSQDLDFGIRLFKKGLPLCRKGKLWVNHYTRYYAIRKDPIQEVKFSARLARKHFFNIKVQRYLMIFNYSYWILLFCFILSIYWISFIPMTFYLFVPIYRTYRTFSRTRVSLNPVIVFINRIKKDILFLYYFLFYRPKKINEEYKRI